MSNNINVMIDNKLIECDLLFTFKDSKKQK